MSRNREIMPGWAKSGSRAILGRVTARGVFLVIGIAVGVGCIGQLPGDGTEHGTAGTTGTSGMSGRGGSTGRGGAPGPGGTTGIAGSSAGQPPCDSTVFKGGACTAPDQQRCYKTCGPDKLGMKSEICAGGVYAEMSGCTFDTVRDYSCYRLPSTPTAGCSVGLTPQANALCSLPPCVVCNNNEGLAAARTPTRRAGPCSVTAFAPRTRRGDEVELRQRQAWPCPLGRGCGSGSGGIGGTTGAAGTSGRAGAGGGSAGAGGAISATPPAPACSRPPLSSRRRAAHAPDRPAALLQDLRTREDGHQIRNLRGGRLRRDVRLRVPSDDGLRLLQDPVERQYGVRRGRGSDGVHSVQRSALHALQQHGRPPRRSLRRFNGRGQGRLLHLPGTQRVRPADMVLRGRRSVALSRRPRLLTRARPAPAPAPRALPSGHASVAVESFMT